MDLLKNFVYYIPMSEKDKLPEDPDFRDAVKGIKRMENDTVELTSRQLNKPIIVKRDVGEPESITPLTSADKMFYSVKPLPNKLKAQLKQGKLRPEENIDLHGLTVKEAQQYLDEFLDDCVAHESFCVCIVHGKGRKNANNPILKNFINEYLRKDPRTLAFVSAPNNMGGTGAVLVLLV